MRKVSEQAQEVLSQLLEWELGNTDIDPKPLLRQVPLADLSVVLSNMQSDRLFDVSVVLRLVFLEHQYRIGNLGGDYSLERKGSDVSLTIPTKHPIKFVQFDFLVEGSC